LLHRDTLLKLTEPVQHDVDLGDSYFYAERRTRKIVVNLGLARREPVSRTMMLGDEVVDGSYELGPRQCATCAGVRRAVNDDNFQPRHHSFERDDTNAYRIGTADHGE